MPKTKRKRAESDSDEPDERDAPAANASSSDSDDDGADHGEEDDGEEGELHVLLGLCADGDVAALEKFLGNFAVQVSASSTSNITPQELLGMADEEGDTPLVVACRFGRLEAAQFLKSCGAKVDVCNGLNETALQDAALGGHLAVVEWLLPQLAPATRDAAEEHGGMTAVGLACLHGHIECAMLLLNLGASASATDTPPSASC